MTETVFVDTNVLVYGRDASETVKQPLASAWIETLWERRAGRLSFQVLQEFYVAATRKLNPGLSQEDARDDIRALLAWRPIPIDASIMENAWSVQDRYRLSWWDSLIVSAAQIAGCHYLLSEDLQTGQNLDGLKVISPFVTGASEIFPEHA